MRSRSSFLLMLITWFVFLCLDCAGRSNFDPYEVLGVGRDATQDQIRRSYRKLCLKLHPDKNVHKSSREQQKSEELFKRVQKANSQIGDEAARRQYDSQSSFQSYYGSSGSAASDAFFFRTFNTAGRSSYSTGYSRTPFYFNGVDISNLFARNAFSRPSPFNQKKSVYVEKVKVPLEDLYMGGRGADLVVHDTIWKRYRAALRGGIAAPIALQSLGMCFPLLFRVRLPVFAAIFGAVFHSYLPRPTVLRYESDLRRGWKGGTKLKFKDIEQGFVIVFVLEEEKHERFERVGNDLHTTITIDAIQAKEGCTVVIEPLSELEMPIDLVLKPNQIQRSGQKVTLKGKGWPQPKTNDRGDLVVAVKVVRRRKRKSKNKQARSELRQ